MKKAKHLAIFIFLGLVNIADSAWSTNAWPSTENVRMEAEQRQVQAYLYEIVFTNYLPPFTNGVNSNEGTEEITTHVFIESITHPAILRTNWHEKTYSYNLRTITNTPYTYTLTVSNNAPIITNAFLQARDIWSYESYEAALERSILGCELPSVPYFYRSSKENLQSIKNWIKQGYQHFYNNELPLSTTISNRNYFNSIVLSNLLDSVGAPTNYLDYTPSRDLGGSLSYYLDVMDYTFVLIGEGTNIFTNTVFVPPSTTKEIVGTNGQIFVFTSTNNFIQSGYTKNDYGWKYVTNIFSKLTRQVVDSMLYGDNASIKQKNPISIPTVWIEECDIDENNLPINCALPSDMSSALNSAFNVFDFTANYPVLVNASFFDVLGYISGGATYNFDIDEPEINIEQTIIYNANETAPATIVCDKIPENYRPSASNYYIYSGDITNTLSVECRDGGITTDWIQAELYPTQYTASAKSGFSYQTNIWYPPATIELINPETNLMYVSSTSLHQHSYPAFNVQNCAESPDFLEYGYATEQNGYVNRSFTVIDWDFKYAVDD